MDIFRIIGKYYNSESLAYKILIEHGLMVSKKACSIAQKMKHLAPDIIFIEEASILHDIGIFLTYAPQIGCFGDDKYIAHGYLGGQILQKEGLFRHARVSECHVGIGLSSYDIEFLNLPLPKRDMMPVSLEEKIICYADKFYSKKEGDLCREKRLEEVKHEISEYGADKLKAFDELTSLFNK